MAIPSQAFMIYKEELAKERLEKERLKNEYEREAKKLSQHLDLLKEQLNSQQQMMESAFNYALDLEKQLEALKGKVLIDEERNSSGYH